MYVQHLTLLNPVALDSYKRREPEASPLRGSRSRCCLRRVPDLSRTSCCLLPVRCCLPLRRMRSVDCCAQSAANVPLLTPTTCVYEALHCLPTTHRCNAEGCAALVCNTCASNICPPGGNENEYHWCPTHWELRAEAEGENEDCESDEDSDPFRVAFRPTGRSQAL